MSRDFSPTLTLGFGPSCNQIYQAKTEELSSWNIPVMFPDANLACDS